MYPPDQAIIDRTTVEGNIINKNTKNNNSLGGAMRVSNGTIVIKDSSFLSNTSNNSGGALYLDCSPTCTITNSTFYANKATGYGGAIFSGTTTGQINMDNVTFASNMQQNTQGNALFGTAVWTINNSIFLDNSCNNSGTGGHVVQWVTSSKSAGSGPCISGVTAGDPKLSAPADNGGPTFTMLPGAGSAVLQAGANCEATDQRGQTRSTATCDVGSVEVP
jgi:predicted outer membrane repeat protein